MRRDESQPTVVWNARVPAADKQMFLALMPMRGAITWFIETSMTALIAQTRDSPALQELVHKAIRDHRYVEETPTGLEEFLGRVRTELYKEFNKLYPEQGSAVWLARKGLASYLARNTISADEEVFAAVRSMLSGLEAQG